MHIWLVFNTVFLALLTVSLLLTLQWMYHEIVCQRRVIERMEEEMSFLRQHVNCQVAGLAEETRKSEDLRARVSLGGGGGGS